MKKENFENAMTDIKDEYITEAAEIVQKKRKKTVWKIIPAAAAIAACLMVSVNAVAPVDLGFYLRSVFGDGYEMVSEMVSMPDNVAQRYSDNSISLDLRGIVGDGQVVKVFVDLTTAADIEIPDGLGRAEEFALFDLRMRPTGMPWEQNINSYTGTGGIISKTTNEDGSTVFSYVLTLKSEDGVNGGKYLASCTKMSYYDADIGEEVTLLDGEWNLAFMLNYKDISESIALDVSGNMTVAKEMYDGENIFYEYSEAPVEIYEAVMSPLSLGIYWKSENEYMETFSGMSHNGIVVTMKDGSVIVKKDYYESEEKGKFRLNDDGTWYTIGEDEIDPIYITGISSGGSVSGHSEPYMGHMIITFDAPLDTENVKSVTVGGIEIDLG